MVGTLLLDGPIFLSAFDWKRRDDRHSLEWARSPGGAGQCHYPRFRAAATHHV